jgi:hypothetical protein
MIHNGAKWGAWNALFGWHAMVFTTTRTPRVSPPSRPIAFQWYPHEEVVNGIMGKV